MYRCLPECSIVVAEVMRLSAIPSLFRRAPSQAGLSKYSCRRIRIGSATIPQRYGGWFETVSICRWLTYLPAPHACCRPKQWVRNERAVQRRHFFIGGLKHFRKQEASLS